jgi:hypothetical protein
MQRRQSGHHAVVSLKAKDSAIYIHDNWHLLNPAFAKREG